MRCYRQKVALGLIKRYRTFVFAGLILTLTGSALTHAQITTLSGSKAVGPLPKVIKAAGRIEIGREITFTVEHLSDWAATGDPSKLVLFINGRSLDGLYPEQTDLSQNTIQFHIRKTPNSKRVWTDLFHAPVFNRPVTVSLGLEGQTPFDSVFDDNNPVALKVISKTAAIVAVVVILGTLLLFGYLARTSNLLRDSGPSPEVGKYRPFNLGRVQMAFWFFLISVSYVCLWLITGDVDTIGPPHLALAGISGLTALGTNIATKGAVENFQPTVSKGFFVDILSDAGGYRFHRFQMFAWNILLGIIFAATVYNHLEMPRFSANLLVLTGISAATNLGFTFLETNSQPRPGETNEAGA